MRGRPKVKSLDLYKSNSKQAEQPENQGNFFLGRASSQALATGLRAGALIKRGAAKDQK
jgi:hypothetical protein